MKRKLIHWLGLTGIAALISYSLAVILSPMAYPGYNWMEQAVSDLSAQNAPSKMLWTQLAAVYNVCSVVCPTCLSIFVSEHKTASKTFRTGIYLFTLMCWISNIGYAMFPLADAGKDITAFQETMHIVVTAAVVLLSIVSLILLMISAMKAKEVRTIGIWALIAFLMMLTGAVGQGLVPPQYFGIVERFSVFAAVGFNAILGWNLFHNKTFRN